MKNIDYMVEVYPDVDRNESPDTFIDHDWRVEIWKAEADEAGLPAVDVDGDYEVSFHRTRVEAILKSQTVYRQLRSEGSDVYLKNITVTGQQKSLRTLADELQRIEREEPEEQIQRYKVVSNGRVLFGPMGD